MSGQHKVANAKDFYDCAKSFAVNTKIFLSKNDEVQLCKEMLSQRWSKDKAIPGTRSFHYFAPSVKSGFIAAAVYSRLDDLKDIKM